VKSIIDDNTSLSTSSQSKTIRYPPRYSERDRWIRSFRSPKAVLDPWRPQHFLFETERSAEGREAAIATVFLTNRECPWRCLMCDLWEHTTDQAVPVGAISAQIDYALNRLGPARYIKLYNSGSFFDPRAIPPADYPAIARRISGFERVIVECHPALVNARVEAFRVLLRGELEVAMGLEIAHPTVLRRLNKKMTLDRFQRAADFLRSLQVGLRVFILVKPPFLDEDEASYYARKSLEFAFDCGAGVAVLIPTRGGNGAMEALATAGEFAPPKLSTLEQVLDFGVSLGRGRVFADLWDLQKFAACPACFTARQDRLRRINLSQSVEPVIGCQICGNGPYLAR
jgi:archaeosine synthase beta-subunit